ncbi:hypothetical protein ABFA25_10270 [Mycobacterium lepromatosis]|uniref:hypothetical protein n=1 Tax=Mycobacterium lepromatosis TaxID=480418 RepID=UPI001EDBFC53|nr:hypothetical protein [Mycobacterium lepromatosis]
MAESVQAADGTTVMDGSETAVVSSSAATDTAGLAWSRDGDHDIQTELTAVHQSWNTRWGKVDGAIHGWPRHSRSDRFGSLGI